MKTQLHIPLLFLQAALFAQTPNPAPAGGPTAARDSLAQSGAVVGSDAEPLLVAQAGPINTSPFAGGQPAASADSVATRAEVDGVRSQVLVLDEYVGRTLDRTVARSNRPLNLAGNIQTRYLYIPQKHDTNTLAVPLASLNFRGSLYKDYSANRNLTYALGLSSTGLNSPTLTDANLAYSVLPSVDLADPSLNVSLGQQKKPFGLEAQSTEESSPSVVGSAYLTGILSDINQRDIGAVIRGDLFATVDYGYNYRAPLIQYAVGVFNGSGANTVDNTESKEVVLRAVLSPPVGYYNALRGLSMGVSYDWGDKLLVSPGQISAARNVRVVSLNGRDTANVVVAARNVFDTLQARRVRIGADLAYIRTPVNFTAEAVWGAQDSSVYDATAGAFRTVERNNFGGAITLFVNLGEQFLRGFREQSRQDDWWPLTYQPFFRVDGFDPDVEAHSDWQLVATGGLNVFFARTSKFQFNYRWRKTEDKPAQNHEYLTQFQFGF
jgi:hypothetical protein